MKTILEIINEKQKKNYIPTLPITISSLNKAQLSTIKEIAAAALDLVSNYLSKVSASDLTILASAFFISSISAPCFPISTPGLAV